MALFSAPEVAYQGLLHLVVDLARVLAHQALDRAVQHGLVVVVNAHAGSGIGAHRDAVGAVHALNADVDGEHAKVQGAHGLEVGQDHGTAAVNREAEHPPVAFRLAASDHQDAVRGSHAYGRLEQADKHQKGDNAESAVDDAGCVGENLLQDVHAL
ncbi:MAG TPA: hypothetical protein PK625_07290 [Spirochaetales bacterium]|nr:hypothetical protein [Spirochaetales bacterium]